MSEKYRVPLWLWGLFAVMMAINLASMYDVIGGTIAEVVRIAISVVTIGALIFDFWRYSRAQNSADFSAHFQRKN